MNVLDKIGRELEGIPQFVIKWGTVFVLLLFFVIICGARYIPFRYSIQPAVMLRDSSRYMYYEFSLNISAGLYNRLVDKKNITVVIDEKMYKVPIGNIITSKDYTTVTILVLIPKTIYQNENQVQSTTVKLDISSNFIDLIRKPLMRNIVIN